MRKRSGNLGHELSSGRLRGKTVRPEAKFIFTETDAPQSEDGPVSVDVTESRDDIVPLVCRDGFDDTGLLSCRGEMDHSK